MHCYRAHLKKTLEEETSAHEAAVASMRSKHTKAVEDLNEQLEGLRKVKGHCRYKHQLVTSMFLPAV